MHSLRVEHSEEKTDHLGYPFTYRTLFVNLDNIYFESTLVRSQSQPTGERRRAVLYLHGYTDYFFQSSLATSWNSKDWAFYALDLQGYGRSIRPDQSENISQSLSVYHYDLLAALTTIKNDGYEECVILAHSTGGLVASRFLQWIDSLKQDDIEAQADSKRLISLPKISGLILNSPFLAMPFSPKRNKVITPIIEFLTHSLPFISTHNNKVNTYSKTLHKRHDGEWDYRLDWKPDIGSPLSFSWLNTVIRSQKALALNGQISTPVLMCHSDKTTRSKKSAIELSRGDGVLDIESMLAAANRVYQNIETTEIAGGYHDLYLSPKPIRDKYIDCISRWLDQLP